MRREKLEHLLTAEMIEGRQREKMLHRLTKWPKVGRATRALKVKLVKATWSRDLWKVKIAHVKKHGTYLIDLWG